MKVLAATDSTQGSRPSDFHWCDEGELVQPVSLICGRDEETPDGGCGCGRAWVGMASGKSTTTATVQDRLGWTRTDLIDALRVAQRRQGWYPRYIGEDDLDEIASDLERTASRFNVGAVVETRLGVVSERPSGAPTPQ